MTQQNFENMCAMHGLTIVEYENAVTNNNQKFVTLQPRNTQTSATIPNDVQVLRVDWRNKTIYAVFELTESKGDNKTLF